MPNVEIAKDSDYAQANITIICATKSATGDLQYILVDSDRGETPQVKFPGLQFVAPYSTSRTLEHSARERFYQQTGLLIDHFMGLRMIMPTRSRHGGVWQFRNVFFGMVGDLDRQYANDGREVYLMNDRDGRYGDPEEIFTLRERKKVKRGWVHEDNAILASQARYFFKNYNERTHDSPWFQRIPCVSSTPLTEIRDLGTHRPPVGCGLAISSIICLYQEHPMDRKKIIMVHREEDEHPGYAGGKIETPVSYSSTNVDPASCCAREGAEEFGFDIQPKALICVAATALDIELPGEQPSSIVRGYNSIVNYSLVAEPINPDAVREALKGKPPEDKMKAYVVESLEEHKARIREGAMRMPDMISIGKKFFELLPAERTNLCQIVNSGL